MTINPHAACLVRVEAKRVKARNRGHRPEGAAAPHHAERARILPPAGGSGPQAALST